MKNLFDFATKELSQDAFLRWLFENWDCEEEDVKNASRELLIEFNAINSNDKIKEIWTESQMGRTDISVFIKLDDGFNVALFIEDKTYSDEHNQLDRYNKYVDHFDARWDLKFNKKIKIYYKTSPIDNDERDRVKDANWTEYSFKSINNFWRKYINSSNLILKDYSKHIVELYKKYINIEKPKDSDSVMWLSYFDNTLKPYFNENFAQYNCWTNKYYKRYSYICFRLKDFDFPGSPYLEIRSRDCTDNKFVARILTYGLDDYENNNLSEEQCNIIRKEIREFISNNKTVYKANYGQKKNKQIGVTKEKNNNVATNELFINELENSLIDLEKIINNLSLYPHK